MSRNLIKSNSTNLEQPNLIIKNNDTIIERLVIHSIGSNCFWCLNVRKRCGIGNNKQFVGSLRLISSLEVIIYMVCLHQNIFYIHLKRNVSRFSSFCFYSVWIISVICCRCCAFFLLSSLFAYLVSASISMSHSIVCYICVFVYI